MLHRAMKVSGSAGKPFLVESGIHLQYMTAIVIGERETRVWRIVQGDSQSDLYVIYTGVQPHGPNITARKLRKCSPL